MTYSYCKQLVAVNNKKIVNLPVYFYTYSWKKSWEAVLKNGKRIRGLSSLCKVKGSWISSPASGKSIACWKIRRRMNGRVSLWVFKISDGVQFSSTYLVTNILPWYIYILFCSGFLFFCFITLTWMILAFQMTKKTEISQFKTPTKRAHGATYTNPTPNKIKKVLVFLLRIVCKNKDFIKTHVPL